ncbi:HEPN-associated N-terminal domain-containing protein [Arachidicoccus sp.]|uniref:HEPN-associated N-terminal domain-containing protein n=1 Tax=Arachidicoccus sp. TaxID=1872624 RepID=UPI003D2543C6
MSGVLEEAMNLWSYGLNGVPDKCVCADHIEDTAVRQFVKRNGEKGCCDYCGKTKAVAELEKVMIFLMETVCNFYTEAAEFAPYNSAEGGYLTQTFDGWEILEDKFQLEINNSKLYDDMRDSIDYGRSWASEQEFHGTGPDRRFLSWEKFTHIVKHRVRYQFQYYTDYSDTWEVPIDPARILKEIGKLVKKYKLYSVLSEGQRLHRARQHSNEDTPNKKEELCAPDDRFTKNVNRMSPAGISMFYAAFELETALLETLYEDDEMKKITHVQFGLKSSVNVIDLSKLPDVPSPFDQNKREKYLEIVFLHSLVRDLAKPIKRNGMVHIKYVPTQIITEYFRYGLKQQIDGLIYPSTKNKGKKAIVLFYGHYESMEHLQFVEATLETHEIEEYKDLFKEL